MKRREFLNNGVKLGLGLVLLPNVSLGKYHNRHLEMMKTSLLKHPIRSFYDIPSLNVRYNKFLEGGFNVIKRTFTIPFEFWFDLITYASRKNGIDYDNELDLYVINHMSELLYHKHHNTKFNEIILKDITLTRKECDGVDVSCDVELVYKII